MVYTSLTQLLIGLQWAVGQWQAFVQGDGNKTTDILESKATFCDLYLIHFCNNDIIFIWC